VFVRALVGLRATLGRRGLSDRIPALRRDG